MPPRPPGERRTRPPPVPRSAPARDRAAPPDQRSPPRGAPLPTAVSAVGDDLHLVEPHHVAVLLTGVGHHYRDDGEPDRLAQTGG